MAGTQHASDSASSVDIGKWSADLRRDFFPLEVHVDQSTPFCANGEMFRSAGGSLVCLKASAHMVSMSHTECAKLNDRFIKVLWQQEGEATVVQEGREVRLLPGSWTMYYASRPYEVHQSDNVHLVAWLCEARRHEAMLTVAQRAVGRVFSTEGGAAVALATLLAMKDETHRLDARSRHTIGDCVTSLLTQYLNALDGDAVGARRRTHEMVLGSAQQYVQKHLNRSDLGPDAIAAELGISRRALYLTFESTGETPQAYIQRLRLERSRDVLADPTSTMSITQVALESGFSDPAYFTRAFRRHFGVTPSECRASSRVCALV